ncbi:unnamed protein product [Protopolystoma xenopodis]|uniref:Uncharacterized protein n=1 Tax=Protopolystoma xenopodis TaxID=117903 RepID=A0A3S5CTA4_9PLAT|nr:unnamed protein product [Protopolystoma xenopodis]
MSRNVINTSRQEGQLIQASVSTLPPPPTSLVPIRDSNPGHEHRGGVTTPLNPTVKSAHESQSRCDPGTRKHFWEALNKLNSFATTK